MAPPTPSLPLALLSVLAAAFESEDAGFARGEEGGVDIEEDEHAGGG